MVDVDEMKINSALFAGDPYKDNPLGMPHKELIRRKLAKQARRDSGEIYFAIFTFFFNFNVILPRSREHPNELN